VIPSASWVAVCAWALGFTLLLTCLLLMFPDGHLPSRRWRPVAWGAAVSLVMLVVPVAIVARSSRRSDDAGDDHIPRTSLGRPVDPRTSGFRNDVRTLAREDARMTSLARPFRRLTGRSTPAAAPETAVVTSGPTDQPGVAVDIPETDPLFAYLQSAPGPVALAGLDLASPALEELRAGGVALVVPLVTQGELIGTLNLGPRLSEQDYSSDDRRLLATLAAQAAPAIRVAQLVREQAAEAAERERYQQELKIAQLIQQQFLPHELPNLPEWQVAAYYGPARVVGGDFYDFIDVGEGRIGVVVGDVTDKGVPAALVMARTHSILRAEAPRLVAPSAVLARANELLAPEMPARMFVTCLYGVLEPGTGRFVFANAGHNLPYVRTADGVVEMRATGLPLGLMTGISYEEAEGVIGQGDTVLLYSDGMVEQHGPGREMYGFPRLRTAMDGDDAGSQLLDRLLEELGAFTGAGAEQEDDITLVTLRRSAGVATHGWAEERPEVPVTREHADAPAGSSEPLLAFTVSGAIGNERGAMQRVAEVVAPLGLEPARMERLKTAVAETVMNAIEYGSQGDPDVPVDVRVDVDADAIRVRVTDRALSGPVPDAEMPDLDAKLDGRQKPRGWGLFLIRHMVDGMDVTSADGLQTVTLTLAREGR
jgi:serine phosphatase RsbU (regulator of sigma subunit)/anti-sigma regulatory factor (Ser/Thr protein kinase)